MKLYLITKHKYKLSCSLADGLPFPEQLKGGTWHVWMLNVGQEERLNKQC